MQPPRTDWDAIVIGGGPAGSTTARYIAEGGADVLVIDGRDSIGSPLQCGELVPSNDEMRRLCPDVPEIDDLLRTPDSAVSMRTSEMRLVPPSGKSLCYDFEGMVLNRVVHDEALVELAESKGAQYLVGSRVESVDGETVRLRDGSEYTARVVIGAGGHNDPLRKTEWEVESLIIPVKFVLMSGNFEDSLELHFGSMAPGGYAWKFPKLGGANIGLGIQTALARGKSLNEYSEEFISGYDGRVEFRGAGSLPMSGSISSFVKGNHLLVGDAAGMVLPSNGAGITIAMIGGRIAGQVVAEHLRDGTPLSEYEVRWEGQMGKVMRNSKRAFRFGSLLFRAPDWLLNITFNRLTKPLIWRAVTCRSLLG
jgi:digeranylgeranylglycerophospholipid reductase